MKQISIQRKSALSHGCKRLRDFLCQHFSTINHAALFALTALLLLSSFVVTQSHTTNVHADATVEAGYTCNWHKVVPGDTLGYIASSYHTSILNLAHTNHIYNINLIFVGQSLCIDYQPGHSTSTNGMLANGRVRWYAYNSLNWSNKTQVATQIRRVAARYGLSAQLLLAIAWQESGWNQHVISRDGGIGVMQIMPYTAYGLNIQTRNSYNPYQLSDNIELGAIYLRSLIISFHGNLNEVISAYNEGGWNVLHRGIFNWRYVYTVRALMYRF